jgi:hypothetical protein
MSNGDLFPLVLQARKVANVFGEPTTGAIGTYYDDFQTPASGATFRLPQSGIVLLDQNKSVPPSPILEGNSTIPDSEYFLAP